jgi:fructose-specific phosphotransferase system IIC component
MASNQRGSTFGSIFGIVVCGGTGGVAAWAIVSLMGWDGVTGALVAAVVGMIVATAVWTAVTSMLRAFRRTR